MSRKEIFLILILIIIAVLRFLFFLPKPLPYDRFIDQKVLVRGLVTEMPDIRLTNKRIVILPENQESKLLVILPLYVDVEYGDMILVKGILEKPENFLTDANKEFNYIRYLKNKNIYFIIQNAEIEILSENNGNKIKSFLFYFNQKFQTLISKSIGPVESYLASGILLGARGGFDKELRDKFINTGTIHIVALSGYNVSIIAKWIIDFFILFFSKIFAISGGIIVIILFIIMTGGASSAIRASIMASILLITKITGRNYYASRALIIAFLLMCAYDLRVVTDISFQLSFLATAGILFIPPKIINYFSFLPIRFGIRENAVITISATITTLPLIIFSTGILSLVSVLVNILILPLIPIAMLFSFISGILGFIYFDLSLPFSFLSKIILGLILKIVDLFSGFSFTSVNIEKFSIFFVIIIYILMSVWVFRKNKNFSI